MKTLPRGVLVLLKFHWAPDIMEFVLGRFSHFNIAIAYSNSTFCGAWTPSFCEFTQIFSKTSTPLALIWSSHNSWKWGDLNDDWWKTVTGVWPFSWNFDGFQVKSQKLGSSGATEFRVWIGNCNVKVWKSTEYKLHKIWRSLEFLIKSGKRTRPRRFGKVLYISTPMIGEVYVSEIKDSGQIFIISQSHQRVDLDLVTNNCKYFPFWCWTMKWGVKCKKSTTDQISNVLDLGCPFQPVWLGFTQHLNIKKNPERATLNIEVPPPDGGVREFGSEDTDSTSPLKLFSS